VRLRIPKVGWRRVREAEAFSLLETHASLCESASDDLVQAVKLIAAGKEKDAKTILERLFDRERAADWLRRRMLDEFAKGVLPPLSREDIMRTVRRLDVVVDWLKDGGRLLSLFSAGDIPAGFEEMLIGFVEKLSECVHLLGGSLRVVIEDYRRALEGCQRVEEIERDIDHMYVKMLGEIKHFNKDDQTPLLLVEFLRALESAADECENTADFLRIMIVSTFH
jgi:predicted phosphate transport protein (TIGR00153 family)